MHKGGKNAYKLVLSDLSVMDPDPERIRDFSD
jgi:hypothetical protein